MVILIVSHRLFGQSHGGTEVLANDVARGLVERGHSVIWLSVGTEDMAAISRSTRDDGVEVWLIPPGFSDAYPLDWRQSEKAQATGVAMCLDNYLDGRRIEAVHLFHFARIGLEFLDLAQLRGVPCFATLTDYTILCADYQLRNQVTGAICDGDVDAGDCVQCLGHVSASADMREAIRSWRERNRSFLSDCFEGVFVQTPYQGRVMRNWALPGTRLLDDCAAYAVPGDWERKTAPRDPAAAFTFGFLGRVSKEKGLSHALEAFALLLAEVEEGRARFRIVTPDPDLARRAVPSSLTEAARGLIEFAEPVQHHRVGEVLADMDCLLIPSVWMENHPTVLSYALSLGVFVLCSDVPSLSHLRGLPGLHFAPVGDAAGLSAQMRALMTQDEPDNPEPASLPTFEALLSKIEACYQDRSLLWRDRNMNQLRRITQPRDFIVPNEIVRYGIKCGEARSLTYLQVELTDKCNLACASCPRAVTASSRDILSVHAFRDILETTRTIRQVSFVGGGEAFMLKNFADYVAECSQRGIFSSVNTNGVLIEKRLADAVKAGLGKIAISVDAADDMLMDIRSGLTKEHLQAAMRLAVELVANTGTRLSAAVTLGQGNLSRLGQTLDFIADTGIREVTIESIHHWADDKTLNRDSLFHADQAVTIRQIETGLGTAIDRELDVEIFDYFRIADPAARKPMYCAWPWDGTFVTCKGEVTPCCINLEASRSNTFGHLSEAALSDIWHGPVYQRFRHDSLVGKDWSFCSDCVYRMQFGEFFDE